MVGEAGYEAVRVREEEYGYRDGEARGASLMRVCYSIESRVRRSAVEVGERFVELVEG